MLATSVKWPLSSSCLFDWKLRRGRKTLILHTILWSPLIILILQPQTEPLSLFQDTRRLSFSTVLFFLLGCTGVYLISQARVPLSWKMYYRRQRRIVSLRSLGTLFTLVCLVWLPRWGWSCWQHILILFPPHIFISLFIQNISLVLFWLA